MIRTTTILAIAVLLPHIRSAAQQSQKLNIDKATVFLSGAELSGNARVSLVKGENEFIFTNVAGSINTQSIVVGATNGAAVELVTFQNNYTASDNLSPRVKELKDSIELMNDKRVPVANKIAAIAEQIAVLQANRKVGGDNSGLSVVDLQKMLDLVGTKMEACLNQKAKEEAALKKIDERIAALNKQMGEEQAKSYQPGGQLRIKLYARENTASNITVKYVVPSAGWSPTYDVMAADAHSPVKIYYKANIYQNSGVRWDNIALTLSTGNPQEGMQAPVLQPWYLSFIQPHVYRKYSAAPTTPQAYEATDKNVAGLTGASMNDYVTVDNSGINTTFDIDVPYTIPSDGQEHLVAVKQYELPATYTYFAAPKADPDAFLVAHITNWQDLGLMPGSTNIFYENTYVGKGYYTPSPDDTLSLSLGRDKKIIIKRERDKKLRTVKTIGTNVREEFEYTITIRNTRKEAATIDLQDQIPVSNDKDIVLEDINTGGSDYNQSTGIMKWSVSLKPNEMKTLRFGFTLKYPRGKTVSNMPQ